jgi:SAM-dependent methyltransferase
VEEIGVKQADQRQQLVDLQRLVKEQEEQSAEEERQLADIRKFVSAQQEQTGNEERQLAAFQEFVSVQQEQTEKEERQLAAFQEFVSVQQEQTEKEERQLADIGKFVVAQQKQTTETHRQFEEHQKQLSKFREDLQQQVIDLNYKLIDYQSEIGVRFQHTADLRQHEQLVQELRTFIGAQEAQTLDQHRQIAEQQKQLSELNTKLVEYQYHADARYRLAVEQQEQDKRQLTELQDFIRAQGEANAEKNRQLEEQQEHISKLASEFGGRQEETGVRLEQVEGKQQHQAQQLADMQMFVGEQQKQTEEENRQLAEQRSELGDVTARLTRIGARQDETGVRLEQVDGKQLQQERQFADLQKFVSEQQKQTEEEHRQLIEQRSELADVTARLTRIGARQDETGVRLEQVDGKQLQQERQFADLQKFVSEQQKQTEEEHRQLMEQGKQLAGVNAQLIEYQNDACARYHLTVEQQEQEKRQLEEMQGFIRAQEKQTIEEQRQLEEQQAQLTDVRARLEEFLVSTHTQEEIGTVRDKVNALQGSFAILQTHLAKRKTRPLSEPAAHSLHEDLKQHETDAFYLAFENQFRGDREEIKQRLRFYLPIIEQTKAITGNASAVDVGCGRGEWLELLQEHGYQGVGVDLNVCMVEECRSRGLKAEVSDAIAYLRALPPASLSLLTGFHIVEHLAFNQLFELFRESLRVLRIRGTAIFETPNPECAKVPAYSFYLDPTHRNPIPHELLCFAARQAGFGATRVERLQAYFEEGVFKGHLDYAGIFTK